ncbi:LysE family translocator [Vibrio sp. F74]|uniref:LysE family translocator n=1 Tax=Vibrio sp. F74 TaxID=700020 RepID=UPI0035F5332D
MNNLIFAMATFAFVGAVTPGPVNVIATSTAASFGLERAMKHVAGASLSYALVVFLSGSIMHIMLELLPMIASSMQVLGSLFLLYMASKIYLSPITSFESTNQSSAGFWTGFVVQAMNPKAWLVAMSGVSLYVIGQDNEQFNLAVFTLISLVICLIGVGLWAVLGRVLSVFLENPIQQKRFNRIMAGLLTGCVVIIWL